MLQIANAQQIHAQDIANFQCNMAMETEKLKLDKQLVFDAVKYLISHHQYGNYFISILPQHPNQACSSLLVTYQNQYSWWIQSVYVQEQHRRKGVFTSMFKAAVESGKSKGSKSIQLYVEKQNKAAKKTYQKLGMYCNGNQFYGYELVYGESNVLDNLKSKMSQNIAIVRGQQIKGQQNNLQFISGAGSNNRNKSLYCYEDKQLIGQCQYFYEFSDWRFGLIVYINLFKSIANVEKAHRALDSFTKFLYQNSDLKIGAIRMIIKQKQLERVKQIMSNMHRDVYDVMQIDL